MPRFVLLDVRLVALALPLALYGAARLPEPSADERAALAARFAFARMPLPAPGRATAAVRRVHPAYEHISAWMSSVGASVALADLDGDGLPNDACYVDPRIDRVLVTRVGPAPAPYPAFALDLARREPSVAPMGCRVADANEDGHADVLVYYWGRSATLFLQRSSAAAGDLSAAAFRQVELAVPPQVWYSNTATFADLDGDSHLEIVVGNYFPDDAAVLDASGGGRPQMPASMSRAFNGGRNRLFRWVGATAGVDPSVAYDEVAGAFDDEVAHAWTLAVGAADLDGDLLPELYFANDFGPDRLLHNRSHAGALRFARLEGRKTLTTPSSKVLGRDSFKGMSVDFADTNGDGWLDIYVSNIANEFALEESHFLFVSTGRPADMQSGVAPYVDRSEPLGLSRSGWAWDARLADFDNDGTVEAIQAAGFLKGATSRWPELHEIAMGNDTLLARPEAWPRFRPGDDLSGGLHNPFYVRATDGRYVDIAPDIGLDEAQVSRGVAIADVDGDGRLDFATANQWETSYVFVNRSPRPGAFLGLHVLMATEPAETVVRPGAPGADTRGRPAIGATVAVTTESGRRLVGQVDGGSGHSGARGPSLHFGLGAARRERAVPAEIAWRDPAGTVRRTFVRLPPGWHTVRLGWREETEDGER